MRIDGNWRHDHGDDARVNGQPNGEHADAAGTVSNEDNGTTSTRGHRRWSDADVFQRVDANQDGVIDQQEFSSGLDQLRHHHHHRGRGRFGDAAQPTAGAGQTSAPTNAQANAVAGTDTPDTLAEPRTGVDANAVWAAYNAADSTDWEYDGIVSLGNLSGELEQVFEAADADSDGVVTEAEVEASVGAPTTSRYAHFALDESDIEAARNAYNEADSTDWATDGIVSLGNLVGGRPAGKLERFFTEADEDLDGVVTEGELDAALTRARPPAAAPVPTETPVVDAAPVPPPTPEDVTVPGEVPVEPAPASVTVDAPASDDASVQTAQPDPSTVADTTTEATPEEPAVVATSEEPVAAETPAQDEAATIIPVPTLVSPTPAASANVTLVQAANQVLEAMLEAVEDAQKSAAATGGSSTTIFMAALVSYTHNSGAATPSSTTFQASA